MSSPSGSAHGLAFPSAPEASIVAWGDDPDPGVAEVVCEPCAAQLPREQQARYGHAVYARSGHLTSCARCGRGGHDVTDPLTGQMRRRPAGGHEPLPTINRETER